MNRKRLRELVQRADTMECVEMKEKPHPAHALLWVQTRDIIEALLEETLNDHPIDSHPRVGDYKCPRCFGASAKPGDLCVACAVDMTRYDVFPEQEAQS